MPTVRTIQTLHTGRLDLVQLNPDRDAELLHLMLSDPEVDRYAGAAPTRDVAASHARLTAELQGNGGWTWVIRVRPSVDAIGTIGLFYDQGTSIRGLNWSLRRDHWGRGIMSEAAPVVVDHLLAQPGIDGVEAWIDTRNTRSLGVARRARLDERGRLPRVYDDHVAQQVVMARAAEPHDPEVLTVRPILEVRDLPETVELLTALLGLCRLFVYGEPPTFARLGVAPWAGSPGLDLRAAGAAAVRAATVMVEVGIPVDEVYQRATASGVSVDGPPVDQPWGRREVWFSLADGHRIGVSGPTGLLMRS